MSRVGSSGEQQLIVNVISVTGSQVVERLASSKLSSVSHQTRTQASHSPGMDVTGDVIEPHMQPRP